MCALAANAGAALHGEIMGISYEAAQRVYYAKVSGCTSPRVICASPFEFELFSSHNITTVLELPDAATAPVSAVPCFLQVT
jgi:hypothetical protein